MNRQFYTRHPETGAPIALTQGESGFYPVVIGGDNSPSITDEKLAATNAIFNNTAKDIEIALACSMFGWDIPMAGELSTWNENLVVEITWNSNAPK